MQTVLAMVQPREGETALDLYSGVGLFAAALGEAVGPQGKVVAVESDAGAVAAAAGNLARYPSVLAIRARVDDAFGVPRASKSGPAGRRGQRPRKLRRHPLLPLAADLVVLDPPRTGAGKDVVAQVARAVPAGHRLRRLRPGRARPGHLVPARAPATTSRSCGPSTRSR